MSEKPFNMLVGDGAWRFPPGLQPQPIFKNPLDEPPPASVFDVNPGARMDGASAPATTPSKRDMALAYGAKILMDRIAIGEGTAGDAGYDTTYDHKERLPGVGLPTQKTINEWNGDYGRSLTEHGGKRAIGKAQFTPIIMPQIQTNLGLTGEEVATPELQDRMFREALQLAGYGAYLDGKLTKEEFAQKISNYFASVGQKDGRSRHNQPVGTTYDEITSAIDAAEAEARRQGYVPGQKPWR